MAVVANVIVRLKSLLFSIQTKEQAEKCLIQVFIPKVLSILFNNPHISIIRILSIELAI